jgi:hypothetical protein
VVIAGWAGIEGSLVGAGAVEKAEGGSTMEHVEAEGGLHAEHLVEDGGEFFRITGGAFLAVAVEPTGPELEGATLPSRAVAKG